MSRVRKKAEVLIQDCVACGCCEKVCPLGAIEIFKGIYARVKMEVCVGCGKCQHACPASIISIVEAEEIRV